MVVAMAVETEAVETVAAGLEAAMEGVVMEGAEPVAAMAVAMEAVETEEVVKVAEMVAAEKGVVAMAVEKVEAAMAVERAVPRSPHLRNSEPHAALQSVHTRSPRRCRLGPTRGTPRLLNGRTAPRPTPSQHHDRSRCAG